MRKQHDFKVGDKIKRYDGVTATVERIDPSCNNVYAKDFSNGRRDGEEIYAVGDWRVVASTPAATTTARDFVDHYDKFEVTILRDTSGSDAFALSDSFGARFVHRATVDKRGQGLSYPTQVREYLEEVGQTLDVPGKYIAIAVYGDNDTICAKFSTEKIEQPIAVNFDAA